MPEKPEAPIEALLTELQAGAAQLHELFMAHIEAGFTRAEAMVIIQTVIAAGVARGDQGSHE